MLRRNSRLPPLRPFLFFLPRTADRNRYGRHRGKDMSIFSGIWIPLVTPFADGEVDHAALRALVRRYADAGIAGLVALGTTGEPATLDAAEQDAVLATILDAAQP